MSGILAAASSLSGAGAVLSGAASVFGAVTGLNSGQRKRTADAQRDLAAALSGDLNAAKSLYSGVIDPGVVQFSKDLCNKAWAVIQQQRPDIAKQVLAQMGGSSTPLVFMSTGMSPVVSPVQQVVNTTLGQIQAALATGAQQLGAGATTAVANKIGGNNNAVTVPLSKNTLYLLAAVAVGIILLRR